MMKVQVNTDRNVESTDALVLMVETELRSALERYEHRLTRIEAHLGDEDGEKGPRSADKRCLLEARPVGYGTSRGHRRAATTEQACREATHKMRSLLKSTFGRIDGRDADATIRQSEAT